MDENNGRGDDDDGFTDHLQKLPPEAGWVVALVPEAVIPRIPLPPPFCQRHSTARPTATTTQHQTILSSYWSAC